MSASSALFLVLGLAVVLSPILTMLWPKLFGFIGVLALTVAGIYFATSGKSAFTEITSAVFLCGAFTLSALLAIYRLIERSTRLYSEDD